MHEHKQMSYNVPDNDAEFKIVIAGLVKELTEISYMALFANVDDYEEFARMRWEAGLIKHYLQDAKQRAISSARISYHSSEKISKP